MHRIAENFAERVVEDVGRGMVQHRRVAPDAIDAGLRARALREVAGFAAQNPSEVENRAFRLPSIGDFENRTRRGFDHAAITNLSAAFWIKGRLRDDDRDLLAWLARAGREHFGFAFVAAMADEPRSLPNPQADLGGLASCVLERRVRVADRLDNARVSTREERAMDSEIASVTCGAAD